MFSSLHRLVTLKIHDPYIAFKRAISIVLGQFIMTAIPFDIDTISINVQSVHFKYYCAIKVYLILTTVIDY